MRTPGFALRLIAGACLNRLENLIMSRCAHPSRADFLKLVLGEGMRKLHQYLERLPFEPCYRVIQVDRYDQNRFR